MIDYYIRSKIEQEATPATCSIRNNEKQSMIPSIQIPLYYYDSILLFIDNRVDVAAAVDRRIVGCFRNVDAWVAGVVVAVVVVVLPSWKEDIPMVE